MWSVQKVPQNLHTSILDRKRQESFHDYGKFFVSMLVLLVNNQNSDSV